jgi:hypothetical protein
VRLGFHAEPGQRRRFRVDFHLAHHRRDMRALVLDHRRDIRHLAEEFLRTNSQIVKA